MGLFDGVQVNVFKVVSHSCTDDKMTYLPLTVRTKHMLSSDEKSVKRIKNKLKVHFLNPLDYRFLVPSRQLFFHVL